MADGDVGVIVANSTPQIGRVHLWVVALSEVGIWNWYYGDPRSLCLRLEIHGPRLCSRRFQKNSGRNAAF